jgi:hypothetical protein
MIPLGGLSMSSCKCPLRSLTLILLTRSAQRAQVAASPDLPNFTTSRACNTKTNPKEEEAANMEILGKGSVIKE